MRTATRAGTYRLDIDGLRGVSVMGVVFYHWGLPGFSGGLAGVDVFFVISGFLITRILLGELSTGSFSVARFYERRIRRIFPALFVVLAATALLSWLVASPPDIERFGHSLAASSVFVSNLYFLATTSYFGPAAQHMPLLHLWSLAVEEQFYILFPWLLVWGWSWFRPVLGRTLAVAAALSFLGAMWVADLSASALFYFSGTRFWELLLGALLAVIPTQALARRWALEAGGVAGLGLIALAISGRTLEAMPPAWHAVIPCLGALLVIAAGHEPRSVAARALSFRPMVGVGLISYSLYLWHWPLLVLYRDTHPLGSGTDVLPVAAALVLAAATWRWIELPARRIAIAPRRVFWFAGLAVLIALAVAAVFVTTRGGLSRYPAHTQWLYSFDGYQPNEAIREGRCFLPPKRVDPANFDFATCFARQPAKADYLLLGDSHAAHLWHGLAQALPEINLQQATASGCRPLQFGDRDPQCTRFFDDVLAKGVVASRPAAVILSARWRQVDLEPLRQTVKSLLEATNRVIVIGPSVEYREDVPRLLAWAERHSDPSIVDRARVIEIAQLDRYLRQGLRGTGAQYVSLYEALCPPGESTCAVVAPGDGVPLHFDYGHFTPQGSAYVGRQLRAQLLSAP